VFCATPDALFYRSGQYFCTAPSLKTALRTILPQTVFGATPDALFYRSGQYFYRSGQYLMHGEVFYFSEKYFYGNKKTSCVCKMFFDLRDNTTDSVGD